MSNVKHEHHDQVASEHADQSVDEAQETLTAAPETEVPAQQAPDEGAGEAPVTEAPEHGDPEVQEAEAQAAEAPEVIEASQTDTPQPDAPQATEATPAAPETPPAPVVKKEWPATRVGTKRHDAQMIFIANEHLSMDECIKLAVAHLKCSAGEARSHYTWQVMNGYCPGKVTHIARTPRTATAAKATGAQKVTVAPVSKPTRTPDQIREVTMSVQEKIAATRAKLAMKDKEPSDQGTPASAS